jgi:molybdate transport system substrate-binding protein
MRTRIMLIVFLFFLIALSSHAADQKITAGVAANFMVPFGEITALFEKQTGIRLEPVFTSSGKIYAQIVSGAPYDIFLSADEERPAKLFKDGLVEKPFVYAWGEVVLWSAERKFCSGAKDWAAALRSAGVKKIAVANPETAPYGAAAMAAIKAAGLEEVVRDKLVYPQDIGQAFQYASTGSVDAGFCALSSALTGQGRKGCFLAVDQAPPIVQSACVLKSAANRQNAQRFADFLLTAEVLKVKERYGYK